MAGRGRARQVRFQRIRRPLVASVLRPHENEGEDKRVESILLPRLDTGSTPVSSTVSCSGITLGGVTTFFYASCYASEYGLAYLEK